MLFGYKDYAWVVPYVKEINGSLFLKTLYPSRKYTKIHKGEKSWKKQIILTNEEQEIEDSLMNGEFIEIHPKEFEAIAQSIKARQKDSVLNIRMNSNDLKKIKQKADLLGVKYQSFISELLHRVAHS